MKLYYSKKITGKQILSVEAKSTPALSPGFIRASKKGYNNFIAALPKPGPPGPTLEDRVAALEARAND